MFKNTGTYTVAFEYCMLKAPSGMYVCVFKFSETTGPTEAKFHVAPPWDRGKRWKAYSNDLGHLLLFIIVNPRGRGF